MWYGMVFIRRNDVLLITLEVYSFNYVYDVKGRRLGGLA